MCLKKRVEKILKLQTHPGTITGIDKKKRDREKKKKAKILRASNERAHEEDPGSVTGWRGGQTAG